MKFMNTLPGDEDLPEEEPWPDEDAPESWSFDEAELEELPGDDVIAINEEFYRSLEALNLDRMEKVWHNAEWVTCVHPGGPMLTGWEVSGTAGNRSSKVRRTYGSSSPTPASGSKIVPPGSPAPRASSI